MKIAYFDCFSGISGDMILGALADLGLGMDFLREELKKLGLKGYEIKAKKIVKNGISATRLDVVVRQNQASEERSLKEINVIIDNSRLAISLKNSIKKIFHKIAIAEAKIHNKPVDKVHFHEVGAIDAMIDIAGAVVGLKKLGIDKIYCSRLNVGRGFAEASHGKFPVPSPAAAEILKGTPIYDSDASYNSDASAELVTPTGAAIITVLANEFGNMPAMKIKKIGYGAGSMDLKHPNVLRVFLGEEMHDKDANSISVIETNIDNMSPEIYPYVVDRLLDNGALDAYLTNIMMKKGRAAVKLTVLAEANDTNKLCNIIFDETTTLGVRIFHAERKTLQREIKTVKTKYGSARLKISRLGNEIKNIAPEYEDCARIAKRKKIPLKQAYDEAKGAFKKT